MKVTAATSPAQPSSGLPLPAPAAPLRGSAAARVQLTLLGLLSLGLLSLVDDPLWRLLPERARVLAAVRLPSLCVCLALCLRFAPSALGAPQKETRWRPLLLLGAAWLLGTALFAQLGLGVTAALPRTSDLIAFLGTGLLAEELLFRGALQALAERAFPGKRLGPLPLSALVQAGFFSLSHAQYHGYSFGAALPQICLTFPMGVLFGWIFSLSGSLWPVALLHLASNLTSLTRSS